MDVTPLFPVELTQTDNSSRLPFLALTFKQLFTGLFQADPKRCIEIPSFADRAGSSPIERRSLPKSSTPPEAWGRETGDWSAVTFAENRQVPGVNGTGFSQRAGPTAPLELTRTCRTGSPALAGEEGIMHPGTRGREDFDCYRRRLA